MSDTAIAGDTVRVERPARGAVSVVEVDGTLVALAETADGYVAFDDTCTHRECPLSEGVIEAGAVTCPCHKSRFDLRTGEPLNGPATLPIRVRRVKVDGDYVFVER